jgi:hypothetical protein
MKSYQSSNPIDAELNRVSRLKSIRHKSAEPLGPQMISFFKQSVQRRQTQMSKIAEVWSKLVPDLLNEHCALDSLTRGSLTVLVDTSSHLYELKQLLLAGLQQQLLLACKATGLRKITLKQGRWYDEADSDRKIRFER